MINLYELIGVNTDANLQEIDEAIKSQIRKWSKRVNSSNLEKRQEAEKKLEMLNDAQEILLDEEKRKRYDQELINSLNDRGLKAPSTQRNTTNSSSTNTATAAISNKHVKYYKEGDYDTALYFIEAELEKRPNDENLLLYYAKCYEKIYKKGLAAQVYEKIIKLNPANGEAIYKLAIYYLFNEVKKQYYPDSQQGYKKAWTYIKLYEEAFSEDPNLYRLYIYYYSFQILNERTMVHDSEQAIIKIKSYADLYIEKYPNDIKSFPFDTVIDCLVPTYFTEKNSTVEELIKRSEVLEKYYNIANGKSKKDFKSKAEDLIAGYFNHAKRLIGLDNNGKWRIDVGNSKDVMDTVKELQKLGFKSLKDVLDGLVAQSGNVSEKNENNLSKAYILLGALLVGMYIFPGTPFNIKIVVNLVLVLVYEFVIKMYEENLVGKFKSTTLLLMFLPSIITIWFSVMYKTYFTMAFVVFLQLLIFSLFNH